jgi:hypothetical protein
MSAMQITYGGEGSHILPFFATNQNGMDQALDKPAMAERATPVSVAIRGSSNNEMLAQLAFIFLQLTKMLVLSLQLFAPPSKTSLQPGKNLAGADRH